MKEIERSAPTQVSGESAPITLSAFAPGLRVPVEDEEIAADEDEDKFDEDGEEED
jgi:hypothetical protein